MPSQYQLHQLQERNETRRRSVRRQQTDSIVGKVARALRLDHCAEKLGRQLARNASGSNEAQPSAAEATNVSMRWRIFWLIAILAAGLDYMAAGHIGEALAQLIAPAFHPLNTNMPVVAFCIRQLAILLFVLGMIGCTLAAKYLSNYALEALKTLRTAAQPGQHLQFWSATAGVVAVYVAKLGYIVLLGVFYLGFLFGFAREYAILSASAQQETLRANQLPPISITLDGSNVHQQTDPAQNGANAKQDAIGDSSAERLAGAPRVYYAIIVLIGGVLMFFPVRGFSQVYHESKQVKLAETITDTREKENETLRAIYDQIRVAPTDLRQDLILAAEPVVDKINMLFKRTVIQIAGRDGNSVSQANDSGDDAAGAVPSGSPEPPPQPNTPTGDASESPERVTESPDVYAAIFGSSPPQT